MLSYSMYYWLDTLNLLFALGGVALIPVTAYLFFDYYFNKSAFYKRWLEAYVWYAIMLITIGSVVLSLVYSEYFGFIPCSLCWLQRIALYPQALFVVIAFKIKDNIFFPIYSIALSIFGLIVGLYHYAFQLVPKETLGGEMLPCLADGTADCAEKVINEFGFVTFPLLSAITFAVLIVLYLNMHRAAKEAANR